MNSNASRKTSTSSKTTTSKKSSSNGSAPLKPAGKKKLNTPDSRAGQYKKLSLYQQILVRPVSVVLARVAVVSICCCAVFCVAFGVFSNFENYLNLRLFLVCSTALLLRARIDRTRTLDRSNTSQKTCGCLIRVKTKWSSEISPTCRVCSKFLTKFSSTLPTIINAIRK